MKPTRLSRGNWRLSKMTKKPKNHNIKIDKIAKLVYSLRHTAYSEGTRGLVRPACFTDKAD